MTNDEKANELAYNKKILGRYTMNEIRKSCFEMAQWKDEQFAQEKQQMIDKACDKLKHLLEGKIIRDFIYGDSYDTDKIIEDCIKAMKG